jgi:hypothetical protein
MIFWLLDAYIVLLDSKSKSCSGDDSELVSEGFIDDCRSGFGRSPPKRGFHAGLRSWSSVFHALWSPFL